MLVTIVFFPLPDDEILDWSKLKQIADDILKGIQKVRQNVALCGKGLNVM